MRARLPSSRLAAYMAAAAVTFLCASPRAGAPPAGDPPRAPERLAETGLYDADGPGAVRDANRPFSPQYPLWSDGAAKARWVYLPPGSTIDTSDAHDWKFPTGTRFWKEFSFQGRKVETRLLWKATDTQWVAASYVWNPQGSDALLAPDAGLPGVIEIAPGRRHSIPSVSDCAACHGARLTPLGFNALQLSTERDPGAIHGEPLTGDMLTLRTLVRERRMSPARGELLADPPRIRTKDPATRSVLGYLAANCGTCHNGEGNIAAFGPVLKYRDLLRDGDAVARSLVGHATRWQVPGLPEGETVLVNPASPEASAMLVRMRSRRPSSQMPPLGSVLRDEAAVEAIERWIATDLARAR